MKILILAMAAIISVGACAEPAGHWALGIGSNYGGPGVKFSQGIADNIELYANGGASALYAFLSYKSGTVLGAGVEYAFTGNQHHTFNLGYAVLSNKEASSWSPNDQAYIKDRERLSGPVIGYTYYFSGLKAKGQALGISTVHLQERKEIKPMQTVGNTDMHSLSVSWGYRF